MYSADLDIIGGDFTASFLGLKVEERDYCTKLRMDTYIQELIKDYRLPELCQWSTLTPQEAHQADAGANATGPGAGY